MSRPRWGSSRTRKRHLRPRRRDSPNGSPRPAMSSGWRTTTVGGVATLVKRGRAPAYADVGVLVLSQKCVRDGRVDPSLGRRTDVKLKPVPDWAYIRVGDTLVNSTGTGTLGRAGFVDEIVEPTSVDGHVAIVRPDHQEVVPAFLSLVLDWRQPDIV